MSTLNAIVERFKKPLSLKAAVGYKNMIGGVALILMAMSYGIDNGIIRVVITVFALGMSVTSGSAALRSKDPTDEMYTRHIGSASELALACTLLILVMFALFDNVVGKYFSMAQVLLISAGIGTFLQGLLFTLYEKSEYCEDDEC